MATFFGAAFGVKLLVWGKGPIRRLRGGSDDRDTSERLAELEQAHMLEDYHERLDFTERVLTQQRGEEPKALDPPANENA
jgi:hypothetical protein